MEKDIHSNGSESESATQYELKEQIWCDEWEKLRGMEALRDSILKTMTDQINNQYRIVRAAHDDMINCMSDANQTEI